MKSAAICALILLPATISALECSASDISTQSVLTCDCAAKGTFTKCPTICPLTAGGLSCGHNDATTLNKCDVGCTDDNRDRDACSLYFGGLCRCLKKKGCFYDPNIGAWTLLRKKTLITVPRKVPGILQQGNDNGGWQLGQTALATSVVSSWDAGTLSMNSVASRTEEQIHIHVCDNANSEFRDFLDQQSGGAFTTLSPVSFNPTWFPKDSIYCQAVPNTKNFNMARLIENYLHKIGTTSCAQYHVGAGLVADKHGFTWGCITTGGSAEELFCKH